MVRGGRREKGSGRGTRVYLWQIHVDIWQNQYNIVKLKNKIKKNIYIYTVEVVLSFTSKEKLLLISWLQSPSAVILEHTK